MKNKNQHQRCAQCGRRYTKAQWRRNDFWCPTCKKFVCYGCVTRGLVCPACGTRTNRKIKEGAAMGAAFGLTFMFMSFLALFVGIGNPNVFWGAVFGVIASAALIVASFVFYTAKKRQVRMHEAHLSRLPSGTIPLEQRPGYGDPMVHKKWKEANLARSSRQSALMKDSYPDHIYYGLLGDWDFPVMSKQERISTTSNIQSKALRWGSGTIGLGIFIILLGLFTIQHPAVLGFGIMIILVGSLIVFLAGYAKRMVRSDAEAEVTVFWKTIGFNTAKDAVEKFLREQGLKAELTTTKLPMWQHPEHRYDLPDGNRISFTYSEDASGRVYGWIEIGYRPSGSLAARRLQKELDEFLNQRDLIRRVG